LALFPVVSENKIKRFNLINVSRFVYSLSLAVKTQQITGMWCRGSQFEYHRPSTVEWSFGGFC